jgi:hypothetical protein
VSHARLRDKLNEDALFAARFYRALTVFMASHPPHHRPVWPRATAAPRADAISEAPLEKAHLASMRFERLLKRLAG